MGLGHQRWYYLALGPTLLDPLLSIGRSLAVVFVVFGLYLFGGARSTYESTVRKSTLVKEMQIFNLQVLPSRKSEIYKYLPLQIAKSV